MRTPEGWHKAWRKNAALFQNDANTKNTRHPGSELPSPRLATLACYAVAGRFATVLALYAARVALASAQAARALFHFFACYLGLTP